MYHNSVKIAVEGCSHGELNAIYNKIATLPSHQKPELLIICGDFQAVRNKDDLSCVSMPEKYRNLKDFHEYYNGERLAPLLTVFIGGNHEASNYLQELKFGGWVAPRIYYMGKSNVIWYKGIQIGGISGIYNENNFLKDSYETVPYNRSTIKSIYHVRKLDMLKFLFYSDIQIRPLDVMISHDWPLGIYKYGNVDKLLKKKPFFKTEIQKNKLGSPVNEVLLNHLLPKNWFSAHLHVKFEATVDKKEEIVDKKQKSSDEIVLDISDSESDEEKKEKSLVKANSKTEFLALDKCLPRRDFLAIRNIQGDANHPSFQSKDLYYDVFFLKINKFFSKFYKTFEFQSINESLLLDKNFEENLKLFLESYKDEILNEKINTEDLAIPYNFTQNVEKNKTTLKVQTNPQSTLYCEKFGIDYNQGNYVKIFKEID